MAPTERFDNGDSPFLEDHVHIFVERIHKESQCIRFQSWTSSDDELVIAPSPSKSRREEKGKAKRSEESKEGTSKGKGAEQEFIESALVASGSRAGAGAHKRRASKDAKGSAPKKRLKLTVIEWQPGWTANTPKCGGCEGRFEQCWRNPTWINCVGCHNRRVMCSHRKSSLIFVSNEKLTCQGKG